MSKIFIYGNINSLKNYKNAVVCFNHTAVVSESICDAISCHALILAGGGDVFPFFYNQQNCKSENLNLKRDLSEFALINYFLKNKLPILGICRGMQILNVFFGGNITQDIPNKRLHQSQTDVYHKVQTYKSSLFFNGTYIANSSHHQAVKNLAKCLLPELHSCDGVLEAFSFKKAKVLGVQFHPERMLLCDLPLGKLTFEYFFGFL